MRKYVLRIRRGVLNDLERPLGNLSSTGGKMWMFGMSPNLFVRELISSHGA